MYKRAVDTRNILFTREFDVPFREGVDALPALHDAMIRMIDATDVGRMEL
jgi:hypothetical protein